MSNNDSNHSSCFYVLLNSRLMGGLLVVFCTKCGTQNTEDSQYCAECGASLDKAKQTTAKAGEVPKDEKKEKNKRKNPGSAIILNIIISGLGMVYLKQYTKALLVF